jgi:hypothetical protein
MVVGRMFEIPEVDVRDGIGMKFSSSYSLSDRDCT